MSPPIVFDAIALVAAAVAAVTDVRSGRIPNHLTLPVALGAVALHGVIGGARLAALSFVGLMVAGLVPWLCFTTTRGRSIGGGDVKLFAALGALRGAGEGLEIELSACVLLAVLALVRLAFAGQLLRTLGRALGLLAGLLLPRRFRPVTDPQSLLELRMGPAILAAVAYVCAMDHLARWLPWLA